MRVVVVFVIGEYFTPAGRNCGIYVEESITGTRSTLSHFEQPCGDALWGKLALCGFQITISMKLTRVITED